MAIKKAKRVAVLKPVKRDFHIDDLHLSTAQAKRNTAPRPKQPKTPRKGFR
jgi:hypothetical protein